MFGPILWIVKLLGGLDIAGIAKTATEAYAAKQDAGVKRETIDADLIARETSLSVQEAELNQKIVIAEQGNAITRLARPAIAFPFIAFLWKAIFWDKVIMGDWINGRTDALGSSLDAIMVAIVGSYFIARTVEKTISTVRNKLASN